MEIFPAIDLKEGKAVRLFKGEMSSAKIYSDAPWELAKRFEDMGAKWLHVVDLDGAFAGEAVNLKTVEKIAKAANLQIQIGGGIRDEARIKSYLDSGITRVILGSVALKDPNFTKEMPRRRRHRRQRRLRRRARLGGGVADEGDRAGEQICRSRSRSDNLHRHLKRRHT